MCRRACWSAFVTAAPVAPPVARSVQQLCSRRARVVVVAAVSSSPRQLLNQIRPLYLRHKQRATQHTNESISLASFQRAIRARNELVAMHMYIVNSVATRVAKLTGCERSDLLQEGAIALIRAAERFDVQRLGRVKFSTYAYRAVCTAVWRAVAPASDIIRIPTRVRHALFARESTKQMSEEKKNKALQMMRPSRLDAPLVKGCEQSATLADVVPAATTAPDSFVQRHTLRKELRDACLRSLPKRWATVLIARYGLQGEAPKGVRQVAAMLAISEPRVTQIGLAAMERLRQREPELAHLIYDA